MGGNRELESFVSKFRYLCSAGYKCSLSFSSEKGQTLVCFNAELGFIPPPVDQPPPSSSSFPSRRRSPSYYRRLKKRREHQVTSNNVVEESLSQVIDDTEEVSESLPEERNINIVHERAEEGLIASEDSGAEESSIIVASKDVMDNKDGRKDINSELDSLKKECEELRNQIAVKDMLYDDFKERMQVKYLYDSEDSDSEYEEDDCIREQNRVNFRKQKEKARLKGIQCSKCYYFAKSQAGLKIHMGKKHK